MSLDPAHQGPHLISPPSRQASTLRPHYVHVLAYSDARARCRSAHRRPVASRGLPMGSAHCACRQERPLQRKVAAHAARGAIPRKSTLRRPGKACALHHGRPFDTQRLTAKAVSTAQAVLDAVFLH
eukprot:23692-Chlamydomonas_euryale.AAC.5